MTSANYCSRNLALNVTRLACQTCNSSRCNTHTFSNSTFSLLLNYLLVSSDKLSLKTGVIFRKKSVLIVMKCSSNYMLRRTFFFYFALIKLSSLTNASLWYRMFRIYAAVQSQKSLNIKITFYRIFSFPTYFITISVDTYAKFLSK